MAGGQFDAVVAQLNPLGQLAAATYLGGSGPDGPGAVPDGFDADQDLQAIAVGSDGSVYAAGGTGSSDFPGVQTTPPGASWMFVSKLQIADPNRKGSPCMALAVENGASFAEGPIAPGELVTLHGLSFGPDFGIAAQLDPSRGIPTSLADVQVFFDNIAAPLFYVQSGQINAQAPWELAGKTTTQVHVVFNGVSTNPPGVTGGFTPLNPLAFLTLPVSARIGGIPGVAAEVLYAGAAPTLFSGVFQINIRIPENLPPSSSPDISIQIRIGSDTSTDPFLGTTISVE